MFLKTNRQNILHRHFSDESLAHFELGLKCFSNMATVNLKTLNQIVVNKTANIFLKNLNSLKQSVMATRPTSHN